MPTTILEGDLTDSLAALLLAERAIAVDTETSGLDWKSDTLLLCQIFAPSVGAVLLRRPGRASANLSRILSAPAVEKVFHFAPFDLRFLKAACGIDTTTVFCTKAASRLCEPLVDSREHTLQHLLERHLGISVGKGAVRTSDWGALRLSSQQIEYAAADVAHLLPLADALSQKLSAAGREGDHASVCQYMPVAARLAVEGVPNPLDY